MFKTAFLNSKVVNNDVNEAADYLEKGKERNKAIEDSKRAVAKAIPMLEVAMKALDKLKAGDS